jgi:hypothetical protein
MQFICVGSDMIRAMSAFSDQAEAQIVAIRKPESSARRNKHHSMIRSGAGTGARADWRCASNETGLAAIRADEDRPKAKEV